MHEASVKSKNIRRTGIPASRKGVANPEYIRSVFEGLPTTERLAKADSHFHVGDDKQGTRIYQFCDSPLDRIYSRLVKAARRGADKQDELRREYTALKQYRTHWQRAGQETTVGSIDLNSVFASDPSRRQGMPMAESQVHHDKKWREARHELGWKPHIVVENIVCAETSIEVAGLAIGYISRTQARDKAEEILRESGRKLAKLWGIG
jgi:hypothetical protein